VTLSLVRQERGRPADERGDLGRPHSRPSPRHRVPLLLGLSWLYGGALIARVDSGGEDVRPSGEGR
jgi:hypothetical protein